MYIYIFKNYQFIDRVFVNSNALVDSTIDELRDKNGEDTIIVPIDEFMDCPTYDDMVMAIH